MQDEFGQLSKSTDIDDTLREPDFIKKAIGLFSLRETIHSAYSRTKAEVTDTHAAAGLAAAKKPGRIAFGIGLVAAAVGGVLLFSPAGIIGQVTFQFTPTPLIRVHIVKNRSSSIAA